MKSGSPKSWLSAATGLFLTVSVATADTHVTVVADASEAYTQRKFGNGTPHVETYVVMERKSYGSATRDASLDKLTIREVAVALAPELARAHYLPAADMKDADLILAVHWGATTPYTSNDDLLANTSIGIGAPSQQEQQESAGLAADMNVVLAQQSRFDQAMRSTDGYSASSQTAVNAGILGYTDTLRRMSSEQSVSPTEERLLSDLQTERYFVVVRAYDLRAPKIAGRRPIPVWTINLNMRSAGQNFETALARMGNTAADYFGRKVDGITTVGPNERKGEVILGPLTIISIEE